MADAERNSVSKKPCETNAFLESVRNIWNYFLLRYHGFNDDLNDCSEEHLFCGVRFLFPFTATAVTFFIMFSLKFFLVQIALQRCITSLVRMSDSIKI